jgi:hypothetical protein
VLQTVAEETTEGTNLHLLNSVRLDNHLAQVPLVSGKQPPAASTPSTVVDVTALVMVVVVVMEVVVVVVVTGVVTMGVVVRVVTMGVVVVVVVMEVE